LNALANLAPMSVVPEPRVHRWTRAEYDERVAAGFFDDLRVSNRHIGAVALLQEVLTLQLHREAFIVVGQSPFALSDISEPQPDVMVCRRRPDLWRDDHVSPADIVLVTEISLSGWSYDSGRKLAAYALGGLTEVWLVNLNTDTVHVCRKPVDDQYTERFTVGRDGALTVPGTDVTIAVAAFLI
jgi:Uma2 family endonuclease